MRAESMAFVSLLQSGKAKTQSAYGINQIDGRTRQGRAVRGLVDALAAQLGNGAPLSPMQATAIERAATLSVLASEARRSALFDPALIDQAVRVENLAGRALKALGISSAARKPQGGLADYLRQKERAAS